MVKLLANALFMSTPLILGACGEVVAERTGMMVTAVEGIFLFGAWGGFVGAYLTKSLSVGFLAAIACGVLVALLYAVTTIHMQQNQVVMGTAVNILMTGICEFFYRVIFGTPLEPLTVKPLPVLSVPLLSGIPVLGTILFRQNLITYLTWVLVPAVLFLLYRTSLGLTLRSTGENPEAVDVAGISVSRVRLLAVLFAGILGGIAGAYYSIGDIGMYTTSIISGRGWICLRDLLSRQLESAFGAGRRGRVRHVRRNRGLCQIARLRVLSKRAVHGASLPAYDSADGCPEKVQRPGKAWNRVRQGALIARTGNRKHAVEWEKRGKSNE